VAGSYGHEELLDSRQPARTGAGKQESWGIYIVECHYQVTTSEGEQHLTRAVMNCKVHGLVKWL
jgi:hypothetical protein